jgi:hypothetical protein
MTTDAKNRKMKFQIPKDTIESEAAINIAAPPERVACIYHDVDKWGETFPATIEHAKVIKTGDKWQEIEVEHKQEGCVPNTLYDLSPTQIGLKESKPKFNASFLNTFFPAPGGGTRYVIHAYVSPKGIYKILKPFLKGYVHRQSLKSMKAYVLDPLKAAAEKQG